MGTFAMQAEGACAHGTRWSALRIYDLKLSKGLFYIEWKLFDHGVDSNRKRKVVPRTGFWTGPLALSMCLGGRLYDGPPGGVAEAVIAGDA